MQPSPAVPTAAAVVTLRPVSEAQVTTGFWADRMAANRAAIPLGRERLEAAGNLGNLRIAAGEASGDAQGASFRDSDVYKWLEAVAWDGSQPLADLIGTISAAQRDDGYLNSAIQVRGEEPYTHLWNSHELYCAGHLFQAAVAATRATGDTTLLQVAIKFADHLADTFGPSGRTQLEGHPVIESALVELYRETGNRRYLDLAKYFVDARGHGRATKPGFDPSHYGDPAHYSDRVPVRDADTLEGHAVRAVYFATGATDVAIETNDLELLDAVRRQYDNMRQRKQHVTGAVGSRWDGEAFGDDYELPPDRAYAETCAAIGVLQWAWRLLLATGDSSYADQIELLLYNAILPAVSLEDADYFYVNTLHRRTGARGDVQRAPAYGRRPWFNCACCPANVMRTLASLPAYLATGTADGLQIHQYAGSTLRAGSFAVDVDTDYPWDGRVTATVREAPAGEVELALRIPEWASDATVDDKPVTAGDYARVRRVFQPGDQVVLQLPMPPRLLVSDDRVDSTRGCVAIARGPLVYALEQPDQQPDVVLEDLRLDPTAEITAKRTDLLGGITVLHSADLTLIPYYAWANRGLHPMRVWIPAG
ncbi:glycoside hydrolase family 127 protein [Kribbella jiaozuonensis]|uniref:Glycoside hydrolase family 127 protein n=1 Tax=Kribbella jiaozuonensis TaxID=2575441 RepID=A0A4V5UY78_9ACTN|nr:beta-L-arabinofuranosidase domain-containing protein [Kribbella jiaozuonensis]TKK77703.1 glycoside hydrolase family 127 protein [Kribbella jiaozuonensis]